MKPEQNNRFRNSSASRRDSSPRAVAYESHGPNVTIRGGAQQVAEKYLQLARDAYIADNRVGAENYLQHAEHYLRLVAAAKSPRPEPAEATPFGAGKANEATRFSNENLVKKMARKI